MAAKRSLGKASDVARSARSNPYIQRLVEDADLRSNLRQAYDASRNAYGRLANGKAPAQALLEDKKLHRELRQAASSLKEASSSLQAKPRRRRRGGVGRTLVILGIGAIAAVALSEGLRAKLLDALFGAEEEFDYSATTTPPTPAPDPVTAA